MKPVLNLVIALTIAAASGMAQGEKAGDEAKAKKDGGTVKLFNGKNLKGWEGHLQDDSATPEEVFQVKDGAIWIKGTPNGYLRTKKAFGDFKLSVEWCWPETPGNSGVLLRISGEDQVWPLCMEAQLKSERAGDVVGMGCDFNENTRPAGEFFRVAPRKNDTNEKTPGEWNAYEITCKGDTIEVSVNGMTQNRATGVQVLKGYIGLQSEGAPIMFRNLKLTPVE